MSPCSARHRFICKAVVATLATLVLISGFSWSLADPMLKQQWRMPLLPWASWAMFTWDNDSFSQLQITGILEDGREVPVNMEQWFRYRVGFQERRYNWIARPPLWPRPIRRLAGYVCRRYNEKAQPGQRMVRMTIADAMWSRGKHGPRPRLEDVPASQRKIVTYLNAVPCP